MISTPENVRQDLITLLPSSLLNELTCFVFYDNHPRDKRNLDITICTSRGEVKEFYKRDLVNSTIVNSSLIPTDIRILRSDNCRLFYLVSGKDEIAIVSSENKLVVLHKISNIDTFEVGDFTCRGRAHLKITCKDDAVPLYFNDNFEILGDRNEVLDKDNKDDSLPIITQLSRKLTEVKYSVKCNEKVLKDLTNLRQIAAYSDYTKCSSIEDDTAFQEEKVASSGPLKLKSHKPEVKICNKKIAIILEVVNSGPLLAENVHIMLHTSHTSSVYSTNVYEKISNPPYLKEKATNSVTSSIHYTDYTTVVAVIDLKELKSTVTSRITLSGVVSYKVDLKDYLLSFEDINLSSLDTMGDDTFDVLSTIQKDANKYNIVAFIATSQRAELCLRHIKSENQTNLELLDMFCEYLNMKKIINMNNIVLHDVSPYHILYGIMVILEKELIEDDKWIISLYTRSPDQILAFIHYMHDAIPFRIVATTTSQRITHKIPELAKYDEITSNTLKSINYSEYKLSMLKQTSMILEYLDECMIRMNENKNPVVQSKVGSEIDVFAVGVQGFQEFKEKVRIEVARGIRSLCEDTCDEESEGMVIDID